MHSGRIQREKNVDISKTPVPMNQSGGDSPTPHSWRASTVLQEVHCGGGGKLSAREGIFFELPAGLHGLAARHDHGGALPCSWASAQARTLESFEPAAS